MAALTVAAAFATAAQASFHPDNTSITITANNPSIAYGIMTITCATGTATGKTGNSASNLSLTLTFNAPCAVDGLGSANVTCSDTVTLVVTDSANTSGTVNLDTGFNCTFTVPLLCTIQVNGPQTTGSTGTLNEATTVITLTLTMKATRTGSFLCGPASGSISLSASYNITPHVEIV